MRKQSIFPSFARLPVAFLTSLALAVAMSLKATAQKDSIFIYTPDERQGLHAALLDSAGWHHLGQLCASDYGPWGAEKRMHHPSLCRAKDGSWRLVFAVNDHSPVLAAAYSADLISWRPQDYPQVQASQCQKPVVSQMDNGFNIYFMAGDSIYRMFASEDFRHFSPSMAMPLYDSGLWNRQAAIVDGQRQEGQRFAVSSEEARCLRRYFSEQAEENRQNSERMHNDNKNMAFLPATLQATLTIDDARKKPISDKLIGIFFEDISYAADGGLYAELVQNRDFEYSSKDRREWDATTAWHSPRPISYGTVDPLSPHNPTYALLERDSIWNEGWDGMAVAAGQHYDFSIFARGKKTFSVQLIGPDGTCLARQDIKVGSNSWQRYECVLTPKQTASEARLLLLPRGDRSIAHIDMVSLFPQETFKGRKNGLRKDLAETIAALKPKFVRFPGGCMSHGQGLDNIYHWYHTIGELQDRVPDKNIWHYHQTRGLGFYEYFLFCEDIGAEPLPVLAAGVPCQNSAANSQGVAGQQGGIPMDEMPAYIDELCNLIDWANADPATNVWARKRAEAGHPEPFNLKYLGIGNEDIISTVFEERYVMICQALRKRHPEIKVCGTVGPFHTPSADYLEGWDLTRRYPDLQYMTDEHYYESTGWFLHHRDYYDRYDRQGTKVYLGEWAASTSVKRPNLETALAEALYLTDIERNGDIVEMTSYAPMLCKDGHSNWNPDMIYFSNTGVRTTPAYDVQRLFSVYGGDNWISSSISIDGWTNLNYRVGASLVEDSKTGRRFLKLVNALPVSVQITARGLELPATVKGEQMTGSIDDQKVHATAIETSTPLSLPPYTLRVIAL